ncbi:protein O-mannosyl-transferase 1 isoform 3-T7 [Megaptera novaeangliae]
MLGFLQRPVVVTADVNLNVVALTAVGLLSRLWQLSYPRAVVFDEVYYGQYISFYMKRIFFLDGSGPPFGHMLLALGGYLGGFDGNFLWNRIGAEYSTNVPVWSLRLLPALAGALSVPMAYQIVWELGFSHCAAVGAALLILIGRKATHPVCPDWTLGVTPLPGRGIVELCVQTVTSWRCSRVQRACPKRHSYARLPELSDHSVKADAFGISVDIFQSVGRAVLPEVLQLPETQALLSELVVLVDADGCGLLLCRRHQVCGCVHIPTGAWGCRCPRLAPDRRPDAVKRPCALSPGRPSGGPVGHPGPRVPAVLLCPPAAALPLRAPRPDHVQCFPGQLGGGAGADHARPAPGGGLRFPGHSEERLWPTRALLASFPPEHLPHDIREWPWQLPPAAGDLLPLQGCQQLVDCKGPREAPAGGEQPPEARAARRHRAAGAWHDHPPPQHARRRGPPEPSLPGGVLLHRLQRLHARPEPLEAGHREQRVRHGRLEDHLVGGPVRAREHISHPQAERGAPPRLGLSAAGGGRGEAVPGLPREHRVERGGAPLRQEKAAGSCHWELPDLVLLVSSGFWPHLPGQEQKERELELRSPAQMDASGNLSFMARFSELQWRMLTVRSDDSEHKYSSTPLDWVTLDTSIAYWLHPRTSAQIHLLGNIVIWASASLATLVYALLFVWYLLRRRRRVCDLPEDCWLRWALAGALCAGGWAVNYVPFFLMEKTLFLYHYLPALAFQILLLPVVLEHVSGRLCSPLRSTSF